MEENIHIGSTIPIAEHELVSSGGTLHRLQGRLLCLPFPLLNKSWSHQVVSCNDYKYNNSNCSDSYAKT
ncbi:hypothetical protein ACJMK2_009472 [Sinanodonta woodiana]|uniref:Uncharacterized protein n=1 Tax=Sinanodonta woodiana TaxID=1069815 RepID=A0ABD3VCM9_SINWO